MALRLPVELRGIEAVVLGCNDRCHVPDPGPCPLALGVPLGAEILTHSWELSRASPSASRKEGHSGLGAEFLMHSTIDIRQQFISIIKQKAQGECAEE